MFTLKNFFYLFIFTSFFLFSNCSDTTEPELSSTGLIPLKVGNTWNYKLTVYDSTEVFLYDEEQTSSIIKDTIINNSTWYTYDSTPTGIWFSNNTTGYWVQVKVTTGLVPNDTSRVVYRFPTQVGDIYGDIESPLEVISTDENITVPSGTFKAIHIRTTLPSSTNYLLDSQETYIVPNIGIVKVMQIGKVANGNKFVVYKNELLSYSLK